MEAVTRLRGGGFDDDDKPRAPSTQTLYARKVAPSGGSHFTERGRDGKTVAYTLYFTAGVDLTNDDQLTVRGGTFHIIVNLWSPNLVEVLCTRGEG